VKTTLEGKNVFLMCQSQSYSSLHQNSLFQIPFDDVVAYIRLAVVGLRLTGRLEDFMNTSETRRSSVGVSFALCCLWRWCLCEKVN